jgi:hypothetical protein
MLASCGALVDKGKRYSETSPYTSPAGFGVFMSLVTLSAAAVFLAGSKLPKEHKLRT